MKFGQYFFPIRFSIHVATLNGLFVYVFQVYLAIQDIYAKIKIVNECLNELCFCLNFCLKRVDSVNVIGRYEWKTSVDAHNRIKLMNLIVADL